MGSEAATESDIVVVALRLDGDISVAVPRADLRAAVDADAAAARAEAVIGAGMAVRREDNSVDWHYRTRPLEGEVQDGHRWMQTTLAG